MSEQARAAAEILVAARRTGVRSDRLVAALRPRSHGEAADIIRETLSLIGSRIAGWKIGHSPKGPTFGPILADLVVADGGMVTAAAGDVIGFEGEIAIELGHAPVPDDPAGIEGCIAALYPAIELIAPRFADLAAISALEAEADLGVNGGAVLGPGRPFSGAADLGPCRMTATTGDQTLFDAPDAAEKWEPIAALRWLAETLHEVGLPLDAGHIVLLGARTGMIRVGTDGGIAVSAERLGSVTCRLAGIDAA